MTKSTLAGVVLLLGLLAAAPVEAADAVVNPPCNETAFDAALNAVLSSGAGTVTFNCGAGAVIPIAAAKAVNATATVDGGGQVTLSAGNAARFFHIGGPGRLTLANITLRDAYWAGDGGAVHNDGVLVVANSTFRNNRALGSGGAIVSYGPVGITDSLFEGNQAANGGALYLRFAAAHAFILNTIFRNNSTSSPTDGWGGAILTWDGATATVQGGQMHGNTANWGGAIYNTAFALASSVDVTGAWIHHNVAAIGGGGIYSRGQLTMTATAVDSNSASSPTGAGGGLYLTGTPPGAPGMAQIIGGTITGNSAAVGGGVSLDTEYLALFSGTNVRGNTASTNGGGFLNSRARLTVEGGSVQANTAGSVGGGVYSSGTIFSGLQTELRLVDLSDNSATWGGGVYLTGGFQIDRSTISRNQAERGGGVYSQGVLGVLASTFNGNRSTSVGGGGGGVLVLPTGIATLLNSTLSGNTSVDRGGAVSSYGSLILTNVTISGNASPLGGGLFLDGISAILENTIVANSPQGGSCNGRPITSSRSSIASDNTCALVGPGDRNFTDPKLTPLGAYGGPTLVHMLATGSPAIDGVFGVDAPDIDQRGIARPQGGYDIGAVERTATDTDEPIDLIFADGFEAAA